MKLYFLFIILTFIPLKNLAQDSMRVVDLNEITVFDNRLQLTTTELSNTVNIITQPVIQALPVQSLNQLLQLVGGIDVRQRGPYDIQADLSIRGGTFDQTLVLINGVKMIDPQTGHHILNLPLNLQDIERIEVIKGPAARKYGQNAFSGAINIVTRNIDSKQGYGSVEIGKFGLGQLVAGIQLPVNKLKQQFSVSKSFSRGYRHNTDFDKNQYFYQGKLKLAHSELSLTGGYVEKEFGANGFYASPDFTEQYEETQTSYLNFEIKKAVKRWVVTPRIYWRRNQDTYIFDRENPSVYRNLHISNNLAMELNTGYQSRLGSSGIGVEVRREFLASNNLGSHDRTVFSLQAEHRAVIGSKFDIHPGISLNRYSDFGTLVFPGVDLGYSFTSSVKVYGNLGTTYRIPTFTDLYYEDRANVGNSLLEPESALTYELGFKYVNSKAQGSLSIFRRNTEDQIDWIRQHPDDKWKPHNIGNLTMSGLDMDLQWKVSSSVLEMIMFSYTYLNGKLAETNAPFSRYALENLRHQIGTAFSLNLFDFLNFRLSYRFHDRVNLENYHLVNIKLNRNGKFVSPFVLVDNVFDTQYRETNLVPMPGRWIRAGITAKFNY